MFQQREAKNTWDYNRVVKHILQLNLRQISSTCEKKVSMTTLKKIGSKHWIPKCFWSHEKKANGKKKKKKKNYWNTKLNSMNDPSVCFTSFFPVSSFQTKFLTLKKLCSSSNLNTNTNEELTTLASVKIDETLRSLLSQVEDWKTRKNNHDFTTTSMVIYKCLDRNKDVPTV